jgi:hypothetical protein
MVRLPFFRDYYNLVAPLMILVLGLLFASMGFFKYHSKQLEALVLFSHKRESTSERRPTKVEKQL